MTPRNFEFFGGQAFLSESSTVTIFIDRDRWSSSFIEMQRVLKNLTMNMNTPLADALDEKLEKFGFEIDRNREHISLKVDELIYGLYLKPCRGSS